MKWFGKLISGAVMIGVMICVMGGAGKVWADDTLVEFNYSASGKITGDKLEEYGTKDGYNPTSGNGLLLCYMDSSAPRALEWSDPEYNNGGVNIVPIIRASLKNQWGNTPCFLVRLSTKGYTSVKFTAMLGGSSNGPAHWKLQYSLDGSSFKDISSSDITISFDTRKTMNSYYNAFTLPEEVSDKDNIYLKIISSSTDTIVGGNYLNLPIGGEIAINGIRVTGTDIHSIETTVPVTQKVPETTKKPEPATKENNETTTSNGEKPQTTKQTSGSNKEQVTTKSAERGEKENTGKENTGKENTGKENTGENISGSQNERSTYIITQTNAAGETVTSVVYDETSADDSSKTITETGKENETKDATEKDTESENDTEKEAKKNVSKKKTTTSGNIEDKKSEESSDSSNGVVIIIILSAIFIAGIGAAVILQKKKNDK